MEKPEPPQNITLREDGEKLNGAKWLHPDQPLWLPPGSIRAMIVLVGLVAVVFPLFKLITWGGTMDQSVKEILLVIVGYLTAIINKYFESRNGHHKSIPPSLKESQ